MDSMCQQKKKLLKCKVIHGHPTFEQLSTLFNNAYNKYTIRLIPNNLISTTTSPKTQQRLFMGPHSKIH
ncbi:Uncharacterized protein APZ42_024338 [Daphnia magna]|uniref:Uncharacterized protein n=1 Tax=Daphnia magna TaxID=35525 RepID=A0A164UNE9_9CRUS|nr:Uncharacterized protein APZ42_024338 [Daphnia magna]